MEKNWLIRTKSNHILGPISKDKVLELFNNGSIKPDDEICSGNGYWFFIREDDLVKRYLLGDELQGFNPISEAKNVLTHVTQKSEVENHEDITKVGGINLSQLNEEVVKNEVPPAIEIPKTQEIKNIEHSEKTEIKKKINNQEAQAKKSTPKQVRQKQNYIKYLTWIGIILFILLIYYRKTVMRSFIKASSITIISPALAQDTLDKKKN